MTSPRLPLTLVVAVGPGGAIGRRGALPWRVSEDLKHFKQTTLGHAIIMGRKTFESIGKALPGRRNIVVSRSRANLGDVPLVEVYSTLDEAIAKARETDPAPCVIGGGAVYAEALPKATELVVTTVGAETAGDVSDCDAFFPAIDPGAFEVVDERPFETKGVSLVRYRRKD